MKEIMKNNKLWCLAKKYVKAIWDFIKTYGLIILLLLMFLVPFYLQLNLFGFSDWLKNLIRIGTPRDWLSFWSSYLGSIMSIGFAYFNTKYQVNEKSKKDDYRFLIELNELSTKFEDFLSETVTSSGKLEDPRNDEKFFNQEQKLIHDYVDKYLKYEKEFHKIINNLTDKKTKNKISTAFATFKEESEIIILMLPGEYVSYKNESAAKIYQDFSDCYKQLEKLNKNINEVISKIED